MARRSLFSSVLRWSARAALAGAGVLGLCFGGIELSAAGHVHSLESVAGAPVAIVFGAGLAPAGQPSAVLAARVRTAVELYRRGKVEKVLLTGDSERHHDEIGAMRHLAESSGLPASALLLDLDGLSTFDSCLRAHEVFGINRAILVTQQFHMPRALFVAHHLGIEAEGVVPETAGHARPENVVREVFARPLAILLVLLQPHANPMERGRAAKQAARGPSAEQVAERLQGSHA